MSNRSTPRSSRTTDRVGATLADVELGRMREHFTTTSRCEWMFWDAGWRREEWPV